MPRRGIVAILTVAALGAIALGGTLLLRQPPLEVRPTSTAGLSAADLSPRRSVREQTGDAAWAGRMPEVGRARVIGTTALYLAPAGDPLLDNQGFAVTLDDRMDLVVFDGPVLVEGAAWLRVYPLSNAFSGPAEFLAWVPIQDATGTQTVEVREAQECPDGDGISVLAALDPFTRARCVGAASLEISAWTGPARLPTYYRIAPPWLGEWQSADLRTVALHDGRAPGGGVSGTYLEAQLPLDLPIPPFGIQVDVSAHFADPISGVCVRGRDVEIWSVPLDDPELGHLWCATRLVIEQWTPRLGSEGRPLAPTDPQLHRHPEQGPNGACAGVGMSLLAFHMDPTQLDPVWLEPADGSGQGRRIIASFDPGFRPALTPSLVIVDERGRVVARNGTIVNPDGQLDGHGICPTTSGVFFD